MDIDRELAIAQLKALVAVPGALRIITSMVHPDYRLDPDDPASPAFDDVNLKLPSSMVIHDVVRIEGPNHRGQYTAFSADYDSPRGVVHDETVGQPEALLKRLQDWREG